VTIAATLAIAFGLAFPELQRQCVRFASVEILPLIKPQAPAAPALPATRHDSTVEPVIQSVATQASEPFMGPLIPLEIPVELKSKIQSEVRVDVLVAIDQEGNVTNARVASASGENTQPLEAEALRAARQSRFRPAREGDKKVPSEMVLTFLFKPEMRAF
jgi:TonB family protein